MPDLLPEEIPLARQIAYQKCLGRGGGKEPPYDHEATVGDFWQAAGQVVARRPSGAVTSGIRIARQIFANWFAASSNQGAGFWNRPVDWDDDGCVGGLISGLGDDANAYCALPADDFTRFASSVIADLSALEGGVHTPSPNSSRRAS